MPLIVVEHIRLQLFMPNFVLPDVAYPLHIGSRPSDHYFRSIVSVGLSVCLFVCAEFFSAVFDPISIKLGHTLYVWV